MRWRVCHICNLEQDTLRDMVNYKDIVKIYECNECFEDYCDKHGDTKQPFLCDKCKSKNVE